MKVIDSHSHLGYCRVFEFDVKEEKLIESMGGNGVDVAIVQPFPGAPNARETHDRIINLSKKYPGKIFGLVSINPHQDEEVVVGEIERCVKTLGFVGVKVHTAGHAVIPQSKDADVLWRTAKRLGVPLMVHTGPGVPLALPSNVMPRAEEYPEVPVILAHAGFGLYSGEAFLVAKRYENVYVETSWAPEYDLDLMIKSFPNKVLFGSDLPENIATELTKIRSLGFPEETLSKVLGGNAARIFKLKL
ncbi:MAG: amidohydrolase family protein [Aigarchaeota archaeon]|nr:amidohydrolase family protein [Aigarchaeota archaeon]